MKPVVCDLAGIEEHAAEVVGAAVNDLGARVGLWGVESEPRLQLLLLGRLASESDTRVIETVRTCRAHDFTWDEIRDLLGITSGIASSRYGDGDSRSRDAP